ncbi:MAG: MFS transporter [Dehalococcoidia bacterium]|nr:MFS transporter [Dehalococcoidia bacterium]
MTNATPTPAPPAPRPAGKLKTAFAAFEDRDFRYLGLSTLALGLGQWAQQLGLAWLALELTGSAVQLGTISAFRGGVGVVTAPLGGYLADRFPRRAVLAFTTLASAVQATFFAVLILSGHIELWHVYVLAFAGGVVQSFTQPARQSFVYDISTDETFLNAVTMNSLIQNVSRITGPPLAGMVIGFWGTGTLFTVMAGLEIVAVVFTLMISTTTRQKRIENPRGMGSALSDVRDGFAYTWSDKRVLGLIIAHAIPTLLIFPYLPFLALFAKDVLDRGPEAFGQLSSMGGWGSLVGLTALTLMGDLKRKGRMMLGCFSIYMVMVLGFTLSSNYMLSLLALAAAGVFSSIAFTLNNTLIQVSSKNEFRGRVMSVWQVVSGLQPLGALPMGIFIQQYGPQATVAGFVITAMIAYAIYIAIFASVRRA